MAQGATEATLTVERSDATAPGIVTIHTDDGTALGIPPFSRYAFTLTRAVPAAVTATPDLAGTVALVAQASTLSPATANSNPQSSNIVPGASVKLTATAKAGYLFSNWSGQPAGATVAGNVLTFAMPSANTPITATFVTVPTTTGGNEFYGLIRPVAPAVSSSATEGLLSTTFTPGTGALSGKVFIAGTTQSFTATAFGDGSVNFKVGTVLQPTLVFGTRTLGLTYNAASGQLAITLSNSANGSTSTSSGIAKRTLYSATSTVPAALLNAGTKGNYTIAFGAKTQAPVMNASTYPQGEGIGTVTLTNTGAVTLSGTLADGSTVSATSALVEGNSCPLYAQLVTPGQAATVKGGVFLGTLVFDTTQTDSDITATDLLWLRPTVTEVSGSAASALATQLYTAGWPEGIKVDAVGALYNKSIDVATALGLSTPSPTTGNAKLALADSKLTSPVTKTTFNIAPGTTAGTSAVTKIPTADASYTLMLTQNTGAFSGTFTPNWTNAAPSKPAFKGILLQKGANKAGFGYFLSNAVGDTNPESGGVTLSKK